MSARLVALLLLAPLLATPLVVLPGAGGAAPPCTPGVVFQNDDVKVWFHGRKGFVKVFDGDVAEREDGEAPEETGFGYHTGRLVEHDASGNEVASMNLQRAFPRTGACTVVDHGEEVDMTLTLTEDVRGPGGILGQATVTFAYHFNKSSLGAKFDLHVDDWPWQADGELAYAFSVHASGGQLESADNGVGFRDPDGNARGYVSWAPNATATYPDGTRAESLVESAHEAHGDAVTVTLRFTNVTAGYASLLYDPWAGVGDYVVVAGLLVGLDPVATALPAGVGRALRDLA